MTPRVACFVMIAICAVASNVSAAPAYEVTVLGQGLNPTAISRGGAYVAGNSGDAGSHYNSEGRTGTGIFLWNSGTLTTVAMPADCVGIEAHGVNDLGQVVGTVWRAGDSRQGFVYDNAGFQMLPTVDNSQAYAINNSGLIAGWAGWGDRGGYPGNGAVLNLNGNRGWEWFNSGGLSLT